MKLFVWDFHGTLEKGNENTVFETSNAVLESFGIKEKFTRKDCNKLYGKKWWEYFQFLLPKEPHEKHLELQEGCFAFEALHPEIVAKYIQPTDWALEVLEKVSQKHEQILISNTNPEAIGIFVRATGVEKYFPEEKRFAVNAHNPKNQQGKIDVLKKYLQTRNFTEIVAIGDSPEDVNIVSFCNGKKYLYSHPNKIHREADVYYKIKDLREILREV